MCLQVLPECVCGFSGFLPLCKHVDYIYGRICLIIGLNEWDWMFACLCMWPSDELVNCRRCGPASPHCLLAFVPALPAALKRIEWQSEWVKNEWPVKSLLYILKWFITTDYFTLFKTIFFFFFTCWSVDVQMHNLTVTIIRVLCSSHNGGFYSCGFVADTGTPLGICGPCGNWTQDYPLSACKPLHYGTAAMTTTYWQKHHIFRRTHSVICMHCGGITSYNIIFYHIFHHICWKGGFE